MKLKHLTLRTFNWKRRMARLDEVAGGEVETGAAAGSGGGAATAPANFSPEQQSHIDRIIGERLSRQEKQFATERAGWTEKMKTLERLQSALNPNGGTDAETAKSYEWLKTHVPKVFPEFAGLSKLADLEKKLAFFEKDWVERAERRGPKSFKAALLEAGYTVPKEDRGHLYNAVRGLAERNEGWSKSMTSGDYKFMPDAVKALASMLERYKAAAAGADISKVKEKTAGLRAPLKGSKGETEGGEKGAKKEGLFTEAKGDKAYEIFQAALKG